MDVLVKDVDSRSSNEVYIECTEIQPIPDAAQRVSNLDWGLWPIELFERNLQARVDLEPDLSESETSEAKDRLIQLYEEVCTTGAPREGLVDGLFRAWVAPVGHKDLPRLIETHGDPGLFVPFAHDPLQRLLATIRKKLRQTQPGCHPHAGKVATSTWMAARTLFTSEPFLASQACRRYQRSRIYATYREIVENRHPSFNARILPTDANRCPEGRRHLLPYLTRPIRGTPRRQSSRGRLP
jgi:hypothetical protein